MRYNLQIFFILLLAPFLGLGLACAQWPPVSLAETETLALQEETWQAGAEQIAGQLLHLKESTRAPAPPQKSHTN